MACSALSPGMRRAIRRNHAVVVQFQHRYVQNEGQAPTRCAHFRCSSTLATMMTSGYRKFNELSHPPVTCTTRLTRIKSVTTCNEACSAMLLPDGKQQNVKEREAVPQQDRRDEEPHGQRRGAELRDRQLDSEQKRQDEDADPDQPHQPIMFVKRRLHAIPVIQNGGLRRGPSERMGGQRRPTSDTSACGRMRAAHPAPLVSMLSSQFARSWRTAAYRAKSRCRRR